MPCATRASWVGWKRWRNCGDDRHAATHRELSKAEWGTDPEHCAEPSHRSGVLGAPTLHGAGAQKGPEGPSARRLPSPDWFREYQPASRTRRPFFHSALGLDVCRPLTKDEHRVRFPAGAPHPRVGLLMAGHHRYGSPTLRARVRISPAYWPTLQRDCRCTYGDTQENPRRRRSHNVRMANHRPQSAGKGR